MKVLELFAGTKSIGEDEKTAINTTHTKDKKIITTHAEGYHDRIRNDLRQSQRSKLNPEEK